MVTDNHLSSINELVRAALSDTNIEFGTGDDICTMENMNNKEKFCHYLRSTGREGVETIISELEESGFFEAPASANHHLNCIGGLLQHSLNVCETALAMRSFFEEKNQMYANGIPRDSVIIASLLHDVCKCDIYKEALVNKRSADGKWEKVPGYLVDCEDLPVGHGEKSVYIISGFMRLTREEAMAIRFHMGLAQEGDLRDCGKAFEMYPLALMTHLADMQATYLDEREV